jgi:hypothetical protein
LTAPASAGRRDARGAARRIDYPDARPESAGILIPSAKARMVHSLLRTLVKVAVASLIVGTILAHFGITADVLLRESGLSVERVTETVRELFAWALPNLLLGALVIVPIWLLVYLFRPPGPRSSE